MVFVWRVYLELLKNFHDVVRLNFRKVLYILVTRLVELVFYFKSSRCSCDLGICEI